MGDVDKMGTLEHYARLATDYDRNWAYNEDFLAWMTGTIVATASITSSDRIADVGCGTGLYARQLLASVQPVEPIVCVDPSEPMLAQIPDSPGLRPLHASAEDLASGHLTAGPDGDQPGRFDVLVLKESVHHIPDGQRPAVLAGLADLLAPGGRILVVMLPTTLDYPLFPAALRRFEQTQPDPAAIADHLRAAGLTASVRFEGFGLEIPKPRFLSMVRDRYMSLLSEFDDAEIEDGVAQIDRDHPEPVLQFTDRFAFALGVRDGGRS